MGKSALKSHQRSAKHINSMEDAARCSLIKYVTHRESGEYVHSVPTQSPDLNTACKAHNAVTEAEILWALMVVTSYYSCNSFARTSELFRKMFSDSEVAKAFTCGES